MKIFRLFTAILFLATTQLSFSQSSWFNDNPVWYYDSWTYTGSGYIMNYYNKDTIIQDLTFQVFSCYGEGWDYLNEIYSQSTRESCYYVREENNIVYFYHEYLDTIYELYNFNSMPGDIWKIPPSEVFVKIDTTEFGPYSVAVVQSVDTIYINDEPLKRIMIDYELQPDYEYGEYPNYFIGYEIIEKIGAIDISFFPINTTYSEHSLKGIRCYKNDNFPLYNFNEDVDCDYFPSDINEKSIEKLLVYPNPVSSTAKINVDNCHEIHKIKLWTIDGKRVPIQYNNCEVDFSKIKAGTYILTIHFSDKTINTKIQKI